MKTASVTKAFSKYATVERIERRTGLRQPAGEQRTVTDFLCRLNGNVVTWADQDGECIYIKVRDERDRDDLQSDYHGGAYVDTIKAALSLADVTGERRARDMAARQAAGIL